MTETYETRDRERGSGDRWSANSVTLAGRLAADPVLRQTTTRALASLRVATNTGPSPQFHDVVLWGDDASAVCSRFSKGDALKVEGELRTRAWTAADGSRRRATEVVADRIVPVEVPAR